MNDTEKFLLLASGGGIIAWWLWSNSVKPPKPLPLVLPRTQAIKSDDNWGGSATWKPANKDCY